MRPFIQFDVHLKPDKNQTEQLVAALSEQNLDGAILKINYHVPTDKKDMVDLQAVQRACATAQYVVGIIPIKNIQTRERRSDLEVTMDFSTLLGAYLATKPELKDKKDTLIEKASLLYEETRLFLKEN